MIIRRDKAITDPSLLMQNSEQSDHREKRGTFTNDHQSEKKQEQESENTETTKEQIEE